MECKDKTAQSVSEVTCVLIETLWNVKICKHKLRWSQDMVLIETLWNVKIYILVENAGSKQY